MNFKKVLVGIPTRDRPDYLAVLLFSLLEQDVDFDVLIVNTSDVKDSPFIGGGTLLERIIPTLQALGHSVTLESVTVAGRSETVAVNHILAKAVEQKYGYVFKVDDDHYLPQGTLRRLQIAIHELDPNADKPVLISGVTPWMKAAYVGAAGPGDMSEGEPTEPLTHLNWDVISEEATAIVNHFVRYPASIRGESELVKTQLASAANFMMRPDTRILWSDTCSRSMYCDAAWFIQLQALLNYRLFFDLSLNVWHVAAPTGGCRDGEEGFLKTDADNQRRATFMYHLLRQFGIARNICT